MTFCSADLRSGFDIVAEALDLPTRIKAADVVITGEGKLDRQTREGKTPAGVARLAHSLGKKVYALVGYAGPEAESDSLFDGVWAASSSDKLDAEAVARAGEMLEARAKQIAPEIGGGLELR